MNRCRALLLFPVVIGVGLAVAAWLLALSPSAITSANAERLRLDMNLAEVEAILGGPERDDGVGSVELVDGALTCVQPESGTKILPDMYGAADSWTLRVWTSDRVRIMLWFDTHHRLVVGHLQPVVRHGQEYPFGVIRRWLGI